MVFGGFRPCCSLFQNLFFIDPVENKLARDPGSIGGLYLGSTSSVLFCNPTPGSALVPALISAPVPAPALALFSSNKLFKQFIKAYLESNQGPRQLPAERKQLFKAKVPKVYYGKSHMNCYYFCQQCKDHFETIGATVAN